MSDFNFTSQVCTSRSQSKRLLALGLKKETADMMYSVLVKDFRGKDVPNAERIYSLCAWYKETSMSVGLEKREYIPSWSLHRLLQIIPHNITHNNQEYRRAIFKEWIAYKHPLEYEYAVVSNYDSIYDSCVSCIEWLIKEGYFNKEYLKGI